MTKQDGHRVSVIYTIYRIVGTDSRFRDFVLDRPYSLFLAARFLSYRLSLSANDRPSAVAI